MKMAQEPMAQSQQCFGKQKQNQSKCNVVKKKVKPTVWATDFSGFVLELSKQMFSGTGPWKRANP